ncbi:MAG: hypothetical protein DI547_03490 [Sphingobium sp.]|nr:MAG: hypothetical protein DI547_03490 [Sphingobium sp.]
MTPEERYLEADARAESERARFLTALGTAKSRFAPARLKSDAQAQALLATRRAGEQAQAFVGRHPVATGGVIAGLTAWLLRRPIAALSRRLFVLCRDRYRAIRSHNPEDLE